MSNPKSLKKAVIHIDGDAFFVSCEVAMNPALKGKCVVTGGERSIASAVSYEAKAKGVIRGMPIFQIRKICPEIIVVHSHYDSYGIFSKRMFNIVRRYTDVVEEYSIDECFADITDSGPSYETLARKIKEEVERELGITVSLGLAPNKVLAKVASKWQKPSGLTVISADKIDEFLNGLAVGKIWGIGPQTSALLAKFGIKTAGEFKNKPEWWIKETLASPYHDLWREINGESVFPIDSSGKHEYKSIQKTGTFKPPTNSKKFLLAELSIHAEDACFKARKCGLATLCFSFFLKTKDFRYIRKEITLPQETSAPQDIIKAINAHFDDIFDPHLLYRSTGITIFRLTPDLGIKKDLFGQSEKDEKIREVLKVMDKLDHRFGSRSVYLASSKNAAGKDMGKIAHGHKRFAIPIIGDVT
ncbi:MAG: DNA polymerase IV [bacterium]